MNHKVGMHWLREHPDNRVDLPHIERMQYPSIKLFKNVWDNRDACAGILSVLPRDSYILGRDHDLSEQKQDMWDDPVGTGTRHANEWAEKVRRGQCHLPTDRTFFLGINEPDATNGDRNAIDKYTEAFLDRLRAHGLRGGAFNFSTGHPRTVDGTPNTTADYTVFERSHQAIIRGNHIGVLHIYGTAAVPCAPGNFDRLKACDWQDVEWIVGEMAADEHVIGGGAHDGFVTSFAGHLNDYPAWIDTLIMGINDPRIHSYQIFSYDFSHPWSSFDVREIRDALESYQWQHMKQSQAPTTPPITVHLPQVEAPQPVSSFDKYLRIVTTVAANIRKRPSLDGEVIKVLSEGTPLNAVGETGEWYEAIGGGADAFMVSQVFYIHKSVVRVDAPQTPAPGPVGDNWQRCIAFVLKQEGGLSTDKNDPGNYVNGVFVGTNFGISAAAHPGIDVVNLTVEQAREIYKTAYWEASDAARMSWPLCLAVMDLAVNGGLGRAKEALNASGYDFIKFMAWRIAWYTRLPQFNLYGAAWIRRCSELMMEATR